jgi:hypothetical protein
MKAQIALELKGRHALFVGTHRIKRLNPLPQSDMRTVHYRLNRYRELLTAIVTPDYAVSNLV